MTSDGLFFFDFALCTLLRKWPSTSNAETETRKFRQTLLDKFFFSTKVSVKIRLLLTPAQQLGSIIQLFQC